MSTDDGAMDDDPGGGEAFPPLPTTSFIEDLKVLIALGQCCPEVTAPEDDARARLDQNVKRFDFLNAAFDYVDKEAFPHDEDGGHTGGYVEGTLFPKFVKDFPNLMAETVALVKELSPGLREDMLFWMYSMSFLEGDGSLFMRLTKEGEPAMSKPTMSFAINHNTAFHSLLLRKGFSGSPTLANLTINAAFLDSAMGKLWLRAGDEMLALKKLQFVTVFLGARSMRLGTRQLVTPLGRLVKTSLPAIISSLNYNHGDGFSEEQYTEQFEEMLTSNIPLSFDLYQAGLTGSDAMVGNRSIAIFQSCHAYLGGLAAVMSQRHQFARPLEARVTSDSTRSANTRESSRIRLDIDRAMHLILRVGCWDYNRRSQYLLFLVLCMVLKSNEIRSKERVIEFLQDLMVLVRKCRPS